MLIAFVHLDFSTRGKELLPVDGFPHGVDVRLAGLLDRLFPYMHAEISGLDGIVRHPLLAVGQIILFAVGFEVGDKLFVLRRIDALI